MSKFQNRRREDILDSSLAGASSNSREATGINHIFNWSEYADRLLISNKVKKETAISDNTLLFRPIGFPFLDFSSTGREDYDPKYVRIARFQNEEGNQWLASTSIEEKGNPILKVLIEKGAFAVVGKGKARKIVHGNKPWYNFIATDSFGESDNGKFYSYGKGFRGQTQLLFQVIDRLDETNQNKTKLVVRDPYITDNGLIWAVPGFSSFMIEQAYQRLAKKGTRYEFWEDWDMLIARHPHFQEEFGHYFGIAELVVQGNDDPHGSLKEDSELKEMFEPLTPYINREGIDYENLDMMNLTGMFELSEIEPIFNHVKNVLKMIDKDIPGVLEDIARECNLSITDYDFVDVSAEQVKAKSTTTESPKQEVKDDEKKEPTSKEFTEVHNSVADMLSKYVTGFKDGELVYTEEFYNLSEPQKKVWPCDECLKPIPGVLPGCPYCGYKFN